MKFKQSRAGVRYGNVHENLTVAQLMWIGAVAMAYNEAEAVLHQIFSACVRFPGDSTHVSSRINGTDGLVAIIKLALERLNEIAKGGLRSTIVAALNTSLGNEDGFPKLKTYRDAVIHARVIDISSGFAEVGPARGVRSYTLLSEEALEGLYNRLTLLRFELNELLEAISCASRIWFVRAPVDDEHRARLEQSIREAVTRHSKHEVRRRSLPKLPEPPRASGAHAGPSPTTCAGD